MNRPDKDNITELYNSIKSHYPVVLTNISYPQNTGRMLGEVDAMGLIDGYIDFYEAKNRRSDLSVMTAIDQLLRHRHYFKFEGDSYLWTPQKEIESLDDIMEEMNVKELTPKQIRFLVLGMKNKLRGKKNGKKDI